MVIPTANDSEAQLRQPLLSSYGYPTDKASDTMHQDDAELRVGNDRGRLLGYKTITMLTKGLQGISILLVAYLAVNGFWALVRPDLYAKNANLATLAYDEAAYRHYVPHFPKFPGGPDHEHGPQGPPGPPCGPPHHGPGAPPHGPPHGPDGAETRFSSPNGGRAGQHARFIEAPRSDKTSGFAGEYFHYDGSGTDYKKGSKSKPPSNAKKYLPNKVWGCAKLTPGKIVTLGAPIEWRGQHVQVGPSLAGSEVTFVWDGKVGHAPPKEINMYKRDDHHASTQKDVKLAPWKFAPKGLPPHKMTGVLNDPTREYTFNNWTAIFELKIPAASVWTKAKVDPKDVRICSLRELDMTGIGFFTADGIPPKHGKHSKGFDEVSTKFKTVVHLPSDFTRVPMRAGAPPPPVHEHKKSSSGSKKAGPKKGKSSNNSKSKSSKPRMLAESDETQEVEEADVNVFEARDVETEAAAVRELTASNEQEVADVEDEAKSAGLPASTK